LSAAAPSLSLIRLAASASPIRGVERAEEVVLRLRKAPVEDL
jgi:hypothetical protein